MKEKKKVIFVCNHNSARSQMAEGMLRHLHGESYEVYSAGGSPTKLHPMAVQAMAEIGIDISGQRAKGLPELAGMVFDLAVTVCGPLASCPFVPGAKVTVHKEFEDPAGTGDIETFRKVRDEIRIWIEGELSDPDRINARQMPETRLR